MGSETDRRNLARALLDIRIAALRVGFDRSAMDVCDYAETRVADALLAAGFKHPDRGVLEEKDSAAAPAPGDADREIADRWLDGLTIWNPRQHAEVKAKLRPSLMAALARVRSEETERCVLRACEWFNSPGPTVSMADYIRASDATGATR